MQGRTRLVGTILIRCKLWTISIATSISLYTMDHLMLRLFEAQVDNQDFDA